VTARKKKLPVRPVLPPGVPPLLTPAEVGRITRVDPKTITRWAKAERVDFVTLKSGHRRYPAAQFAEILAITGWPV
jgi:predicted site-specific integrase-resolvase